MKKTISVSAWMVLLALCPVLSSAQVRLGVSSEGRKIIFNENTTQRARRLSDRFVPVPEADIQIAIDRHSEAQSLDPKLVRAMIQVESGYNHRARSNKGAMGLMQLMPATASLYSVDDPYDPDENVRGGTRYLRYLVDRFPGRLDLAVAAYNAGPGAVQRYGGVPPYRETKDYVRRVLALYQGGSQMSFPPSTTVPGGTGVYIPGKRKPYITRNSQNRIVVTTALDSKR
ncbi:MAG: lytic transglycosylase domain-containing protein [Acidobacteriota bacterium]